MRTYINEKTGTKICASDDSSPVNYIVTAVIPEDNYTLLIEFIDGSRKRYDVKPLMQKYHIFQRLNDQSYFRRAHPDGLTVAWDDELDIAPETLYEQGIPV